MAMAAAMDSDAAIRAAAIARLDAELMEASKADRAGPPPKTWQYLPAGVLAGYLFGGAIAGPSAILFCAVAGGVAGGFRAMTGRSLLEDLGKNAASGPGRVSFDNFGQITLPKAAPPPPACNKPAC